MKQRIDTIEVLKQLISIPSWVEGTKDERLLGEFIFQWLSKNTSLEVKKECVSEGRFNVIAGDDVSTRMLMVGHMDTVLPGNSWTKDPIKPVVDGDRLYGLGSSDMKSGLAVMMTLAASNKLPAGSCMLFYVDEEYDFAGMRKFVFDYKGKIKPEQIISFDGGGLKVGNGCRGLIEIRVTVTGQSGHAARPESGRNAIVGANEMIEDLCDWLDENTDPVLGPTSCNLAYMNGGGMQGNVIPDNCEFILDIRPSKPEINAKSVLERLEASAVERGVKITGKQIRHDLGSWLTNQKDIPITELGLPLNELGQTGYIDVQMLWQSFNRVPCWVVGAAELGMAHKADEYVLVSKLKQFEEIMLRFVTKTPSRSDLVGVILVDSVWV